MYRAFGNYAAERVGDFVRSGDYSMKGVKQVLANSSQDLQLLVSSMIPVDPIDPGEMALANRSYADRAYTCGIACMINLNSATIRDITDVIRAQGLIVKKLEMDNQVLFSLIENMVEGRSSTVSSLADLGSSTLRGAAATLWALPGVNVTFGLASYAAGTFLDWYSKDKLQSRLREDLGLARHLLLENAVPVSIYDKMDRTLRNKDDDDEKVELVVDWLDRREKSLYESEIISFDKGMIRNDILFVVSDLRDDAMGIAFPVIRNETVTMVVAIVDLSIKDVTIKYIPYSGADISDFIRQHINYSLNGNSTGSSYLASRTPKMAPDDVLEARLTEMASFVKKLSGNHETRRSLVHAFVQSGALAGR
nr:TPA_asm: VP5 [Aedes orbi-like virus]